MKKILLPVISILFLTFTGNAQTTFRADRIDNLSNRSLNTHFNTYSLFTIDATAIAKFAAQQKGAGAAFNLELPGLGQWEISMAENDLISENYTVVANTPQGRVVMPRGTVRTYSGFLADVAESRVSLTLDDNYIYGLVKKGDKEYFIEPLNYFDKQAAADVFVIYDAKDIVADPNLKCGVTEMKQQQNNISHRIEAGTTCVRTELAIASDFSMFTRYGSVGAVTTHNIGVMNNVIWAYVNGQFTYNIEFSIVTQNVSTSAGTDQLTPAYGGTDSDVILSNFSSWGSGGGFGVAHDLGQFWTTRNIDADGAGASSGIIGLAWVDAVCFTGFKYHILEDFVGSVPSGSGYQLRVLTTHEIGHNFSCGHDGAGTPYIMAPSVQITSTWSPASVASVDANAPTYACLGACSASGVPAANFVGVPEAVCIGDVMQLMDHSLNGPTSWSWTLTGGSPSSSTVRNPTVSYIISGLKTISLTSSNGSGASTPYSKKVLVSSGPTLACVSSAVTGSLAGVKAFSLNNIEKVTGSASVDGNKYMNYTCTNITRLAEGTTYTVSVTVGNSPATFNLVQMFIDYNNDGDFLDVISGTPEAIHSSPSCYIGTYTFTFTTPIAASPIPTDQFLRLRIIAKDCVGGVDACYSVTEGQVEDYAVYFGSSTLLSASRIDLEGRHQNGVNILNWKAFNEINNRSFEIERSTDGTSFNTIGSVDSRTTGDNSYSYIDQLLNAGNATVFYYRLKVNEWSGSNTYSKVIPVTIKSKNNGLLVNLHPNPFADMITATLQLNTASTVRMELSDVAGKIVKQETRKLSPGISTVNFTGLDGIASGTYLIKLICGDETVSRLIQKQ